MAKVNFTAARVEGFTCPADKAQAFLWDGKTPGLGLRATVAGAKSYIFQAKIHGGTVRVTIGDLKSWPIDKAQGEARRLQRLIDEGKDPREVKAEQHAAHEARQAAKRRQDVTLAKAWQAYLEANRAKWSERHYRDHVNLSQLGGEVKRRGTGQTKAGPLAALMPLKLSDLSAVKVADWLASEAQTRPTNAEQSYRKLRAFIRWCDDHPEYSGIVPPITYSARSVRDAVPRTNAKDDCLQREQLPAWFDAVRKIQNPVISAYLQSLLITGARREELAALKWPDVDFQWNSLTIRDKVEGERTIPLTPYLSFLLANLKRINDTPPNVRELARLEAQGAAWKPSPWVFASKTAAGGKIAEPRIAHTKALKVAGLPHVSLHGLRRSFGTLCEWVEMPSGISAQIMGHKPSALAEKHYRRRPLDLLRMWHTKIDAWLLEQAGIEFEPGQAKPGLKVITAA
ncbi:integrase family protein [Pandoraea sp. XJJ-1]|uniref:tyrosine-type recombinase/integrase n=1 Tax=Pandoraea sp. XJJ-1 TaxID=3002643 RepID=UPI00228122FF|nr:integrase family protein [Pandoraea sp. XJJ-1]WAL82781.1 integrase family protein [Pandoraea sp. XJJ-1]